MRLIFRSTLLVPLTNAIYEDVYNGQFKQLTHVINVEILQELLGKPENNNLKTFRFIYFTK